MIDIDYRKWGNRPHWRYDGRLLGEDDAGTWLQVAQGTPYTGPRGEGRLPNGFLVLLPRDEWWTACWNLSGGVDLYVDITTPVEWLSDDHVTMVDLDLDVTRWRDGRVEIEDEDEFEQHRVEYAYPNDVVEHALASTRDVMAAVADMRAPLGAAPGVWLDALVP